MNFLKGSLKRRERILLEGKQVGLGSKATIV